MQARAGHDEGTVKGRVLAVDDCAAMREIVRAALEMLGYSVEAVDSGEAALSLVRESADAAAFDAVILDVELPGLDGTALGRALRREPRTAGAMFTMHSSVAEADVRARFSGYDAFVPKTTHPCQLGERVDGLIRARRG